MLSETCTRSSPLETLAASHGHTLAAVDSETGESFLIARRHCAAYAVSNPRNLCSVCPKRFFAVVVFVRTPRREDPSMLGNR
eukprot:7596016-Pyramimonas_sp.AAC.1